MTIYARVLLALIGAYKKLISPFLPDSCRYYPSCSTYAAESIRKYGVFRGSAHSVRRVTRCHPWHEGGFDPVE